MSKIPQGEWSAIAARYAKGESISRSRLREQRDHLKDQILLERQKSESEKQRLESQIQALRPRSPRSRSSRRDPE
jgi:hypothetical protein